MNGAIKLCRPPGNRTGWAEAFGNPVSADGPVMVDDKMGFATVPVTNSHGRCVC
jgi:hypothetical protein